MKIEDMSAQRLREWVQRLITAIRVGGADEKNKPLYMKWLKEAQQEQTNRYNRRLQFMEAKKNGKVKN